MLMHHNLTPSDIEILELSSNSEHGFWRVGVSSKFLVAYFFRFCGMFGTHFTVGLTDQSCE